MPDKKAHAKWNGDLKGGNGSMSSESGVLENAAFTFASRFENEGKSNPEELIAAAHAGCYSMALSNELHKAGYNSKSVETKATISLGPVDGKPTIHTIILEATATIPDIDEVEFQKIAAATKAACPVSRALNMAIKLEATLVN
mgnify:CR=1 FL=1|jgi:osmotically inducible protein OsmC